MVSGATCIAIALTHQQHLPEPPVSAAPVATALGTRHGAGLRTRDPVRSVTPGRVRVVGPVLASSRPVSLAIPAIGVRSDLLRLGLTADGALDTPPPGPTYNQAGWYRYSPTPGQLGPAVIAGHVDSAAQGPSVFFRLGALQTGDTVRITRADGSVAVFQVDDVRRYHKTAFPSQLVYGNTDHAALRLVTCGGPFDRATGHYIDNIVVFASLVHSEATAPNEPQ